MSQDTRLKISHSQSVFARRKVSAYRKSVKIQMCLLSGILITAFVCGILCHSVNVDYFAFFRRSDVNMVNLWKSFVPPSSRFFTCKHASAMMKITLFVERWARGEKHYTNWIFFNHAKKWREDMETEARNFYEEKWVMELFKQN